MLSTAKRRRPADTQPTPPEPGRGPLKVAVLMGGVGFEREVSLVSGREVAAGLARRGHDVISIALDSADERALDAIPRDADVCFLALHGEFGEDGTLQQLLARRGLVYTGSGPEASARAFDKIRAKRLFVRAGIPTAWQRVVEFPFGKRSVLHALRMTPPGTVVVKPSRAGSSVGVSICKTRGALRRAIEEGARFRQDLMIEEFVPGHELTCGILAGEALPVVEARAQRGFFDYTAKYDKASGTEYVVDPVDVPAEVRTRIQALALCAHETLGCADFSRVDFRYDPAADRLIVLELNTIPGLTPTSLLPKGAAAVGIPFDVLVERLCRIAVQTAVQ